MTNLQQECESQAVREFVRVGDSISGENDNDEYVARLPEFEATIFWVVHLDTEINNGGFRQWLGNPTGAFTSQTLSALERIRAVQTAELVRQALQLFPGEDPPGDYDERSAIMQRFGENERAKLAAIDHEYFVGEGDRDSPDNIFIRLIEWTSCQANHSASSRTT